MLSIVKIGNNYYCLYHYEDVKFLELPCSTTVISLQNLKDFEIKYKSLKPDEARLVKW